MNKRVLITGGASGIGRGMVEKYLSNNCKVIILDKDAENLSKTVSELNALYRDIESVVCDLGNEEDIRKTVEWAYDVWGGIDILINNAGFAVRELFVDISLETWDRILDVNLRGTFILSQLISRRMIQDRISGSIVNISSKNGLASSSYLAHYNTSKAGINLLTQSMAVELAKFNIRVNAVAPGFIDTPLDTKLKQEDVSLDLTERTPMKRLGSVEEVANGVYFLASDQASYITGTILVIDGGHLANASEL
ncbi:MULTISPECIES: SDR family NAD(P)-dependent oxidoreductase [Oceanobacillus]|uniref:SDR family NAD(P)-dependent oxidoreductase n=1 Tax=Oceanobacillus TaxID=182709 RepID=UPI001314BE80|nr:SDR family NAD(P)-dependent oxidoreductase [Oceanobacillus profundus]